MASLSPSWVGLGQGRQGDRAFQGGGRRSWSRFPVLSTSSQGVSEEQSTEAQEHGAPWAGGRRVQQRQQRTGRWVHSWLPEQTSQAFAKLQEEEGGRPAAPLL